MAASEQKGSERWRSEGGENLYYDDRNGSILVKTARSHLRKQFIARVDTDVPQGRLQTPVQVWRTGVRKGVHRYFPHSANKRRVLLWKETDMRGTASMSPEQIKRRIMEGSRHTRQRSESVHARAGVVAILEFPRP